MNTKWLLALAVCLCAIARLGAQGTALTYQGRLMDQGNVANGVYSMEFSLHDASSNGGRVAGPITNSTVAVSNGIFTTTIDFGSGAFDGNARWLQIGVRTNSSASPFGTLSPRQAVTPAPYAILAGNFTGGVADAQLSSNIARLDAGQTFSGAVNFTPVNGAPFSVGNSNRVTNLHADWLDGLDGNGFWKSLGNNGTSPANFLGTLDNQPLELRVNNSRALRLEPSSGSPNIVGGFSGNTTSNGVIGSVIAGGGSANNTNRVMGSFSAIGGGYNNVASGGSAVVAGGDNNTASNDRTVVGGGFSNRAAGRLSTVAGGDNNTAEGFYSMIPGGSANTTRGDFSMAAGRRAKATNQGAFVWADSQNSDFGSTASNQFLIRAQNGVGINKSNPTSALDVNGKVQMTQFQLGSSATAGQILRADASGNGTWQNAAFVSLAGDTISGDLTIANAYDLNFGNASRQMLNLWNTNYGIGVQNNTLYMRTDDHFSWFRRGTHNNAANNSGGGTNLMHLDSAGNLTVNASMILDAVSANTGSHYPGLVFAPGSGEAISSQRGTNSNNRWGIDFYTGFTPRMSIANNGNVGINTKTPGGLLDISTGVGNVQFRNDSGLVPGLNLTGGPIPGLIRLRNAMEVWPSTDGTRAGYVDLRDTNGTAQIILNGGSGEATVKVLTITGGADIAEPFQFSGHKEIPKGAVVIIDDENPGRLKLSDASYDTRVAGIVSGANGVNPGIALRQEGVLEGEKNVALTGRVYALADATKHPIRPGDLLTTSDVPGHAMKASDSQKAAGAILGKAMTGLTNGQGHVLVLVSLQ